MPRGAPDWGFLAPQKNFMQLCREQNHFYERAGMVGQGAGRYSEIQLWNPVASGVDAFINVLGFKVSAAVLLPVYWYASSRGTLKAYGVNRYSGGTASEIQTRWVDRGIASYSNEVYSIYAGTTRTEITHLHLWLVPGWGLNIVHPTANSDIEIDFTWYEFLSVEV